MDGPRAYFFTCPGLPGDQGSGIAPGDGGKLFDLSQKCGAIADELLQAEFILQEANERLFLSHICNPTPNSRKNVDAAEGRNQKIFGSETKTLRHCLLLAGIGNCNHRQWRPARAKHGKEACDHRLGIGSENEESQVGGERGEDSGKVPGGAWLLTLGNPLVFKVKCTGAGFQELFQLVPGTVFRIQIDQQDFCFSHVEPLLVCGCYFCKSSVKAA